MISCLVLVSLHGVGSGWCMLLNTVLVSLLIPFSVTIGLDILFFLRSLKCLGFLSWCDNSVFGFCMDVS